MKTKQTFTNNGVTYFHTGGGKWHFTGKTADGLEFEKIDRVHGRANADKVANIIGGGLKRAKNGGVIDGMARTNIHKLIAPSAKLYQGIEFSPCYPLAKH